MTLLPIGLSRVSEPLKSQRLLYQLSADQSALLKKFDQLSSGLRVTRVSDDPAAAGRAIVLQRGIARSEQLTRNAGVAESYYSATDQALGRLDDLLIEARATTVQGAQTVLSADERLTLAETIERTIDGVISTGNAMFREHQLLSGVLGQGDSLTRSQDSVVFRGNDATAQAFIGGGSLTHPIGVTGTQSLGLASTIVAGTAIGPAVDSQTRMVDLRGGLGVEAGVLRVSDGGNWVDVDFRFAATMGDVVATLQSVNLGGRSLTAQVQPDGLSVGYADGLPGTLAIADAAGSRMAEQLSLSNPMGTSSPPLVAAGLSPRLTLTTPLAQLAGGSGIDVSAGIRIERGGETFVIDLSSAETVGDVLVAINRSPGDLRAEIDPERGAIHLRALRSGVDYSIGENGGQAASLLGIRSSTGATLLSDLDRGRGISLDPLGSDLIIVRPDGTELAVELEGALTIDDVIDRIASHPLNQDTDRVVAALRSGGNGIELSAPDGVGPLIVRVGGSSQAAVQLGLVPAGETQSVGQSQGGNQVLAGVDYRPREAGGTIDTLVRLADALRTGDVHEIERLQKRMDEDLDRSVRTRGRVGIWTQNLERLRSMAEDEVVSLKGQLSNEIDADLTTVISEITQKQASIEASLRLIGQMANLSLLNYL